MVTRLGDVVFGGGTWAVVNAITMAFLSIR